MVVNIKQFMLFVITITVTIIWLVYIRRCAWMPIPKPLLYRWSDEELRLATGTGGVTHVQHQLKLCSAYIGVPVRCLYLLIISCIRQIFKFCRDIAIYLVKGSRYVLDESWGWCLTQVRDHEYCNLLKEEICMIDRHVCQRLAQEVFQNICDSSFSFTRLLFS